MRYKLISLLLALGLIFCWALPAWADELSSQGIIVGGTGRIMAVPDMAEITVGVVTQGPTASQAQEENNRLMQAVLQKLKEIGLSEAEIKTGELSLFPEYAFGTEKEQAPRIVSYRATSSLIVTVKPVEKAGIVVDAALAGGANQVHSLRFLVSNVAEMQLKALSLAVQAARQKAEVVAQALGVQLGSPRSVVVEAGEPWIPAYRAGMGLQDAAPVLPGQVEITASVHITYSIVP